ncbi:MAG: MBL fold metallo-hydrolase [Deltaproteobacteria bacterium]|nr:MBL fold metallo-hydrolase [Deltaproteobacteria bacterium]
MRIEHTGKITRDFYALGHPNVPVFLLDGPVPALFDAGFACLASLYVKEIEKVLGPRSPGYLLLTHSHWDHVGAAGYFKDRWSGIRIAGHSRMRDVLSRPEVIRSIGDRNREGARELQHWGIGEGYRTPFKSFDLDLSLEPGQVVPLPGHAGVHVIHTPGHTWEHMSYWIPDERVLVASEAVGCDHNGEIVTEFLVDYDAYRSSLKTLSQLDIEVLCLAHRVLFTGSDVKRFLERSLENADAYVHMVEGILAEMGGSLEETVARVKALQWDGLTFPKQPEPSYLLNTRARVGHVLERMNRKEGLSSPGKER